jgi:hypothetical protein
MGLTISLLPRYKASAGVSNPLPVMIPLQFNILMLKRAGFVG